MWIPPEGTKAVLGGGMKRSPAGFPCAGHVIGVPKRRLADGRAGIRYAMRLSPLG